MDVNLLMQAVSTVGFPIVCCGVLFWQNNGLRETISENTKALQTLIDYIKFKDLNSKEEN